MWIIQLCFLALIASSATALPQAMPVSNSTTTAESSSATTTLVQAILTTSLEMAPTVDATLSSIIRVPTSTGLTATALAVDTVAFTSTSSSSLDLPTVTTSTTAATSTSATTTSSGASTEDLIVTVTSTSTHLPSSTAISSGALSSSEQNSLTTLATSSSTTNKTPIIAGTIVAVVVAMILIGCGIFLWRRKRLSRVRSNSSSLKNEKAGEDLWNPTVTARPKFGRQGTSDNFMHSGFDFMDRGLNAETPKLPSVGVMPIHSDGLREGGRGYRGANETHGGSLRVPQPAAGSHSWTGNF